MALTKTRFVVRTRGRPRALMTLREHKKGDLYISIYSGVQVGLPPDNIKIRQHKYSIHVTENNPNINLVKRTFSLENGEERNNYAYTRAVKSKSGFFQITTRRSTDLEADQYNITRDTSFKTICVGDYDQNQHTLMFSILVGNKETPFEYHSNSALCFFETTARFKIVVLVAWNYAPSTKFAWFMDGVTFRPDEHIQQEATTLDRHMDGKKPEHCLKFFEDCVVHLTRNQVETIRDFVQDCALKKKMQDLLDDFPPESFFISDGDGAIPAGTKIYVGRD